MAECSLKGIFRHECATHIISFFSATCPIEESSKEFNLCIDDILRRIKNMGPVVDSDEAMRCEYISTILNTAVSLIEGLIMEVTAKVISIM